MKKLFTLIVSVPLILCGLSVTSPAQITLEEVLAKSPQLLKSDQYRTVIAMIKALPSEQRDDISIQILESFANLKAWMIDREVAKKTRWLELYQNIKDSSESGATPVLLKILQDSDPRIRYFAVEFLATLGDEGAIPVLADLSENDPHHDVRAIAEQALEAIRAR